MIYYKLLFVSVLSYAMIFLACQSSSPYYDTISNLTHTCTVTPMVVCVDIVVLNKTCVDPQCFIYSGGNISSCISPLITTNVTSGNATAGNNTNNTNSNNNTAINATFSTCNATWLYPSNKTFCLNTTSWDKTVCSQKNVTCKLNSSHCTVNSVVYLGGFFNLKHKDGYGNLPAAEIALKQINNDTKILSNITLSLIAKQSTQVSMILIIFIVLVGHIKRQ